MAREEGFDVRPVQGGQSSTGPELVLTIKPDPGLLQFAFMRAAWEAMSELAQERRVTNSFADEIHEFAKEVLGQVDSLEDVIIEK